MEDLIFTPTPAQLRIIQEIEHAKQRIQQRESDVMAFVMGALNVSPEEVEGIVFDGKVIMIKKKV